MGAKPEKRQPRALLGTPALVSFDPATATQQAKAPSHKPSLTGLMTFWVMASTQRVSCSRADPEEWAANGRLVHRRVVTFGLDWQLPSADHLTWPANDLR